MTTESDLTPAQQAAASGAITAVFVLRDACGAVGLTPPVVGGLDGLAEFARAHVDELGPVLVALVVGAVELVTLADGDAP